MKTKFPLLSHVHRVAHVATYPLQIIVRSVPSSRRRRAVKLGAGATIMLLGVVIAKNPMHLMNHIFADVIGYGLHGYGAMPFIKILCARFDLEDINESYQHNHGPQVVREIDVAQFTHDRAWHQ